MADDANASAESQEVAETQDSSLINPSTATESTFNSPSQSSAHPSSQLSAPATPAVPATSAPVAQVGDDSASTLRCGVCNKERGRFEHHCKTCRVPLCSYIVCEQAANLWMPEENSYFCSKKCVLDYNSRPESAQRQVPVQTRPDAPGEGGDGGSISTSTGQSMSVPAASGAAANEATAAGTGPQPPRAPRTCGFCGVPGHNRTTCSAAKQCKCGAQTQQKCTCDDPRPGGAADGGVAGGVASVRKCATVAFAANLGTTKQPAPSLNSAHVVPGPEQNVYATTHAWMARRMAARRAARLLPHARKRSNRGSKKGCAEKKRKRKCT